MDVGESLRRYTQEHMEHMASKYFDHPIEGTVHFYHERNRFGCEMSIHVGQHIHCESHAESHDPYRSARQSLDRIEKQLRRSKRKLRDHHQKERVAFRWREAFSPLFSWRKKKRL